MSLERANQYRQQAIQLISAGSVEIVLSLLVMWAAGTGPIQTAIGSTVSSIMATIGIIIGLVGLFVLAGGTALLLTADKSPFSRRRKKLSAP